MRVDQLPRNAMGKIIRTELRGLVRAAAEAASRQPCPLTRGQMAYVIQLSAVHNEAMAMKRAARKAEAAEMIDIAARLAPFFPPRGRGRP